MFQRIQKSSTLSRSHSSSFDIIFCGNGTLWWRLASQARLKPTLTSISFAFLILTFQYPYFMQWFYLISGEVQHIRSNVGMQTMVLIIDLLIVASMKWHGKMRVLFYSPGSCWFNEQQQFGDILVNYANSFVLFSSIRDASSQGLCTFPLRRFEFRILSNEGPAGRGFLQMFVDHMDTVQTETVIRLKLLLFI